MQEHRVMSFSVISKRPVRQLAGKTLSINMKDSNEFVSRTPNRIEAMINLVTPKFIKYTGDRTFWITFKDGALKNPDFVIRPFRKWHSVIEVFGTYWHGKEVTGRDNFEEETTLIKKYSDVGVHCLVLWETEIGLEKHKKELLLQKINTFLDKVSSETARQTPSDKNKKDEETVQTTLNKS